MPTISNRRKQFEKKTIINVTAEDIENAQKQRLAKGESCVNACPFANAIARQFPDPTYFKVQGNRIAFTSGGRRFIFPPTSGQVQQMRNWDERQQFRPGKYTLTDGWSIPEGWQAQRSDSATRAGKKYRKTGKTRPYAPLKTRVSGFASVRYAK